MFLIKNILDATGLCRVLLKEHIHIRDMVYGAIERDYLISTLEFDGHFQGFPQGKKIDTLSQYNVLI